MCWQPAFFFSNAPFLQTHHFRGGKSSSYFIVMVRCFLLDFLVFTALFFFFDSVIDRDRSVESKLCSWKATATLSRRLPKLFICSAAPLQLAYEVQSFTLPNVAFATPDKSQLQWSNKSQESTWNVFILRGTASNCWKCWKCFFIWINSLQTVRHERRMEFALPVCQPQGTKRNKITPKFYF